MNSRVLVFPEDVAVGLVGVYHDGAGQPWTAARGNVVVPAGGSVALSAHAPVRGLGCLGPADVQFLDLQKKSGTDVDLSRIAHLTGLRALRCSKSHAITDAGVAHLAGLRQLHELDLYWTAVGDAGLVHLAGMVHLRRLHLGMTRVAGPGLRLLSGLQRLEWLSLEDTDVDDSVVPHLATLRSLKSVALWGTRLSTKGVADLQSALPCARIATRDTGQRLARERARAAVLRILACRLGEAEGARGEEALKRLLPEGSRIDARSDKAWARLWRPQDGLDALALVLRFIPPGDDLRVLTPDGRQRVVPWLRRRRVGRRLNDRRSAGVLRTAASAATRAH